MVRIQKAQPQRPSAAALRSIFKASASLNAILSVSYTHLEYDGGHIENAVLVPNENIGSEMPEALPDKEAPLLVYCRSGRRSKDAAEKLLALGYQSVYDLSLIHI